MELNIAREFQYNQGGAKFVMIRDRGWTEICKKASKIDVFRLGGKSNCGERVLGGRLKRQQYIRVS